MLDGLGTRPRLDSEARRQVVAAIEDYDQSIVLAPGYGWAYASRALAYAALQDHEAVVRDVDAAVKLVGPDPTLLQLRGRAQQALR
jgi:tetratricopeptide (TPR) repeat protein